MLKRLTLAQRRLDLLEELQRLEEGRERLAELEESFVKFAGEYGERKGISFGAWRELGVPASVLALAGIGRPRQTLRRRA